MLKIYLVGGAVRDQLLGISIKERDWVVVGASPEEMLRLGFKPVGKEFPVFLHPETAEEYALARIEKKVALGYAGFVFNASPDVTLEEDLRRRDLTINAMAQTSAGVLIDPYHGQKDLQQKILRHVSSAFSEDPVRILRVARFAARYAGRGFQVAPETREMMQEMVSEGEVDALVAERVWKELERALAEPAPEIFFRVLADAHALPILFPMIQMDGPAIDALKAIVPLSMDTVVRFSVLMHALEKKDILWICNRYRLPVAYKELALLVTERYQEALRFPQLSALEILHLLTAADAFRREKRFEQFLLACQGLAQWQKTDFPNTKVREVWQMAKQVDVKEWINQGLTGLEMAEKMKEKRLAVMGKWIVLSAK